MLKRTKFESATRKGVRIGSQGGSLFNDYKGARYVPKSPGAYVPRHLNGVNAMVQQLNRIQSYLLFTIHQSPLTIHQNESELRKWARSGSRDRSLLVKVET